MPQMLRVQRAPGILPRTYLLDDFAVVGVHMKAKLTGDRMRPLMQVCEAASKLDRFCRLCMATVSTIPNAFIHGSPSWQEDERYSIAKSRSHGSLQTEFGRLPYVLTVFADTTGFPIINGLGSFRSRSSVCTSFVPLSRNECVGRDAVIEHNHTCSPTSRNSVRRKYISLSDSF